MDYNCQKDRYFLKLLEIKKSAYAPYSNFHVACILETNKGWFYGVNVENAAYPATLCAERNAIGSMITNGASKILRIWILTDSKQTNGTACGLCRQVISEFADPKAQVTTYNILGQKTVATVAEILPNSFSPLAMSSNHKE